MTTSELKINDQIKNKSGMVGTVANINGVPKIVVRNESGRITQTIAMRDVNLVHFEKEEVLDEA